MATVFIAVDKTDTENGCLKVLLLLLWRIVYAINIVDIKRVT